LNIEKLHINQLLSDYEQSELSTILVCYSGSSEGPELDKLISEVEQKLLSINLEKQARKRAFSLLIEGIQNIERHAIDHPEMGGMAFFALIDSPERLYLSFGNLVSDDVKLELENQLEDLAACSDYELKERYRNQLALGELSEKGGGGLGLMAMQLKSNGPVRPNFVELAPGYWFFILRYSVSK
jgi:hypothetical protein